MYEGFNDGDDNRKNNNITEGKIHDQTENLFQYKSNLNIIKK